MKFTWLHISDFHIRAGDPYDRDVVLNALVESVARYRERGRAPDLVFATGDVAFSGKEKEYEPATAFFDALIAAAGIERKHLFVIPGNHDVDREMGIGLARTLASREQADTYFNPERPKPHLTQKLGAFRAWYNRYFDSIRALPENSTCGPVELVEVRGTRIGVLPLNSALFCEDEHDHAKLCIGRRCLDPAINALRGLAADLNVALVHHPLDWLSDIERTNIRSELQVAADVVLRGHLHENDVESVASVAGQAVYISAGAAYQTRKWPNRAVYATVDGENISVFPIRYEDAPREVWTVDPSLFPDESGYEKRFRLPRFASSPSRPDPGTSVGPGPPTVFARFRSNIPSRHNLPFIGRDTLLGDIQAMLGDTAAESVLLLHGPPGVGKSELAREFARRQRDRYPGGTFFLDAGSDALLIDLARIGRNVLDLEFEPNLTLQDQCEQTFLSLGNASVLLIYDNVRSFASIRPWLPPAGMSCHVIMTAVADRPEPGWRSLAVLPLSHTDSLDLIEKLAGRAVAERHGDELADLAGGLPVQICPAAATLAYEERRGRLGDARLTMTQEASESFRLVYEHLEPPARLLLHTASFLNGQRIVRGELGRHLTDGIGWTEEEFRRHLDTCLDLHLLEGDGTLRMHQLLAAFLRTKSLSSEDTSLIERVRRVQRERLIALANEVSQRPADSELALALLAFPIRPLDWQGTPLGNSIEDGVTLGRALLEIGQFAGARPWYERAVEAARQGDVHGRVDHGSLGRSLHEVGYCLSAVGEYAEARPWYERAVEAARQGDVHGRVDHGSLGRSLHEVGYCLSAVGEYAEARPWYERAVEAARQGDVHGRVDHGFLGTSLHEVGYCLSAVGEYAEARPWYERAVEAARQGDMHGRVDHAELGRSLHEVGYCLSAVGEYAEARPWYERAVEAKRQGDVHGRVDHAELGRSLHQVGYCLSAVGEYAEARPWYERAVEAARQGDVHGRVDHGFLGTSLHQVGYCLSAVGEYAEARPWYERAVEAARQGDVHGRVDHGSLGRSLHEVGYCLSAVGEYAEARPWYERAVEAARQGDVHGRVDHESLGTSLRDAAFCLRRLGLLEQAQRYEEEAGRLPGVDDAEGHED